MSIGRSIRIYLDDGSISGIRHAEIVNWTGQALSVPRTQIKSLYEWEEAKKPGVYFLFGIDDETGQQALYIGEAENVLDRLQNHVANKDFWSEVVFFTNKDENLTKSHVKYLESRLVQIAQEAGRYILLNGNIPQKPSMPRGDRDAMEEFLSNIRVLLGVIGHKALEKIVTQKKEYISHDVVPDKPVNQEQLKLYLDVKGVSAKAILNDEGLIVLAGSEISTTVTGSLSIGYQKLRNQLIETGVIVKHSAKLIFIKDQLFTSPSQAAAIVVGYSINGRQRWVDDQGTSLKQIEIKNIAI